MVAITNDAAPNPNIITDLGVRNVVACVEAPTVRPNNMVTISIKELAAVLAKRRVTPLSFNKLPKNSIPNKGRPEGTKNVVNNIPAIGNNIFSV